MNILDLLFVALIGIFIASRFFGHKLPKRKKGSRPTDMGTILSFPTGRDTPKPPKEKKAKPVSTPSPQTGLAAIEDLDPSFSKKDFLQGAKAAFTMYYTALAEKDEDTLEGLLSPRLFDQVMDGLESKKGKLPAMTLSKTPEILDSRVLGQTMVIDVTYSATQAPARKGGKTKDVTMIWTWARNAKADDLNWELEEMQQPS